MSFEFLHKFLSKSEREREKKKHCENHAKNVERENGKNEDRCEKRKLYLSKKKER